MFLIMLDGLHIEMAALAAAGKFLDGSGWTDSLVLSGVPSADGIESKKVKICSSSHIGLLVVTYVFWHMRNTE